MANCRRCDTEMEFRYKNLVKAGKAGEDLEKWYESEGYKVRNNQWYGYEGQGQPYWCPQCEIIRFIKEGK